MPPKRVAQSAAEPSTFDIDGFASKFRPPLVSAKMHHRGDLVPTMNDLLKHIQALKASDSESIERSFADTDPLVDASLEYNRLQAEFEAGGFELFEFRPPTTRLMKTIRAKWTKGPHKDDDEWALMMLMAETCVSHPGITAEAFDRLREDNGDPAFGPVVTAVNDAMAGGGVTAPFLPLPLPTPTTETP